MKALPLAFVLLAVYVCATWQAPAALAQTKSQAGTRWEYRVLTKQQVLDLGSKDLATGLNKLGDDGWELTAVDSAYIFKRPKGPDRQQWGDLKRRLADAEVEVAAMRDRAAWSERMVKKGLMTNQQADAVRAALQMAELALEQARRDLGLPPTDANKGVDKDAPPKK
jgi:hypothetical protein